MSMLDVFADATDGQMPPSDGKAEVHPGLPGKAAAVIAFPAHFYVLAPVDPQWVRAQLPPGDYSAPLGARFLVALADHIGAHIGSSDAVLGARAHGHGTGLDLHELTDDTIREYAVHIATAMRYAPGKPVTGLAAWYWAEGWPGAGRSPSKSSPLRADAASAERSPLLHSACCP